MSFPFIFLPLLGVTSPQQNKLSDLFVAARRPPEPASSDSASPFEPLSGQLVNQIICQRCGNTSERPEGFRTLSLDATLGSVEAALAAYVKEELLTGKASCSATSCKSSLGSVFNARGWVRLHVVGMPVCLIGMSV